MKHRFYIIILLAALSFSGMAQTIGEAFYIYRNDGGFNAFFRDEVDSIAYSHYDADSIYYDENVTQLVYTADSLYRIPLAVIDSVGFVTPKNVYKPGVVRLEGEVRSYIVSTDSLTIFFMTETPALILPKIGDYLFTEEVSSVFPIGFIGKVESVQKENGRIAVICSQVDFEDVFEYYYYASNKTVDASRRQADEQPQVEENTWERTWSPGTITFPLTNFTTPNIYPDPLGDLSFDVSNHQSISLTPTFRVKYVRIVTPRRGTEVCLDISEEDVIAEDFSMSGHINYSHDLLSTNDIPFLQLGIPFLWLYGKAGVFVNADATISGEQHFKQTYKYTFHCEGCSRSLFGTRASLSGIHLSSEHSGEIMAKGSIELGIYCELGVAFVDSRIASVAYRGEVGVGIEGNAMLYKKDAETALHSTDVYKTLRGNDIQFKWFYRTGLPVKLLWFGWPNSHVPHDHVFARISLVPNFSDTKLERDPNDNTTLFATTKASGACLPVDLGFTLFEQESTNSIPTSYSRFGYVGMNAEMYASFFNMSTSKKYEVYPTVKLLGIEMLAEPKAEENNTSCPDSNHPHMIDLGLPSGTKWACCNVGASAPEQYGNYYAWGETQPKAVYNWDTYAYGSSWDNVVNIGSDIAGTYYDAAMANWGAPWRMPSKAQCDELLTNCTSVWTTQNGVNGRKFTGPNGGTIFLPVAGNRWGSELDDAGSRGYCWSSTLYESDPGYAWYLGFYSGGVYTNGYSRYCGQAVRPVR